MRETGYYWCRLKHSKKWYVFKWIYNSWFDGDESVESEEYFGEIDEIDEKQIKRE